MRESRKQERTVDGPDAMRRAIARYQAAGETPVVVVLDTRCSWGRVAAAAFAENTAQAQHDRLREEVATGLVAVPEALRVLGAHPCKTNVEQWQALDLDRLARTLAPDTARLLALPLPAPWFFVLVVQDDQLHLSVMPEVPGG